MRPSWWLWLALLLPLGGCTLGYALDPVEPSFDAGLRDAAQPGHLIAEEGPRIVSQTEWGGLYRKTVWTSPGGTFTSYIFCPFGVPGVGEHARCLQQYGGIKADGTESLKLQRTDPRAWDYVFTPSEEWALRWTTVGYPDPYNMGGS